MVQFSVYTKMTLNNSSAESAIAKVRKRAPSSGDILILKITERQYARMEYILGGIKDTSKINTDARLVFLGGEA